MELHEDHLRTPGISREAEGSYGADYSALVEENTALHLVDQLRDRGIDAHLYKSPTGARGYGIRIALRDGREALWDTDGAVGLEATVMRDGMLVGMVPTIEGSETFDDAQVLDAIARTDYDKPIATQRRTAPPPAAPLRREGGVFRRFLGGFRER
jgi:hypothetical protein